MVGDLPAKKLAVRQARNRTHERFRRQPAQPHGQIGMCCRLGEGGAVNHGRDRACGIAPASRNGQREEQRGEARGEVGHARMPRGERTHCALDARMIAPKPAFEQVGTPGHLTRGR